MPGYRIDLQPHFPAVFGDERRRASARRHGGARPAASPTRGSSFDGHLAPRRSAAGFLRIAVKQHGGRRSEDLSVRRGHDVSRYTCPTFESGAGAGSTRAAGWRSATRPDDPDLDPPPPACCRRAAWVADVTATPWTTIERLPIRFWDGERARRRLAPLVGTGRSVAGGPGGPGRPSGGCHLRSITPARTPRSGDHRRRGPGCSRVRAHLYRRRFLPSYPGRRRRLGAVSISDRAGRTLGRGPRHAGKAPPRGVRCTPTGGPGWTSTVGRRSPP